MNDLISREAESVAVAVTSNPAFSNVAQDTSGAALLARLTAYEATAATLIRMAFVAGRWSEGEQVKPWIEALRRLAQLRTDGGLQIWHELQHYPAALLMYAFGLGSVVAEKWSSLSDIFEAVVVREHRDDKRVVELFPIEKLFQMGSRNATGLLPNRSGQYTPLQNHVDTVYFGLFRNEFPSEEAFHMAFDKLEILAALNFAVPRIENKQRYLSIPGVYAWRTRNLERIQNEIASSLHSMHEKSPYVATGIVGGSVEQGLENLTQLRQFVSELYW